jgi:glycosyltransferase involved in cell wall biosynthesis
METGIGGSELAAIELTKWLAERGFIVSVYADITDPDVLASKNPRWLNYQSTTWKAESCACDLLISSRCPSVTTRRRGPTWLWMHDLHVGADWGNTIAQRFDKIVCLSVFAKSRFHDYYPKVDAHKVVVIPNGIAPALYKFPLGIPLDLKHELLRANTIPLRAIWSSCPDRGLDRAIALWPEVRKVFKNAELKVFGNVFAWAERAESYGSPDQRQYARRLIATLRGEVEGISLGGQLGQRQLAQEWMGAHLWLYPTSFEETSCITAMEAQMAGVKIACTPVGALPETVRSAAWLEPWTPSTAWRDDALEKVTTLMQRDMSDTLHASRSRQRGWWSVSLAWENEIFGVD